MTTDFEVEIRSDNSGANMLVLLTASDPAMNLNRKEFIREVAIGIDETNIKDLRGGNPAPGVVQAVAQKLSNWLFSKDMAGFIHSSVLGDGPVRFIFRVEASLLEKLADLPVELLYYEKDWVVLRRAVSSIVHELPGTGLPKPFSPRLPLRILVVRTSPSGLPVKVPPAGPVCNHIIKKAYELGRNIVHLDLVSREAGSLEPGMSWDEFEAKHLPELVILDGDSEEEKGRKASLKWKEFRDYLLERSVTELQPGSWENFTTQMKKSSSNYHILVYLGHGNYISLDGSEQKTGVLQFEKPDGVAVDNVSSKDLQRELQDRQVAIPVVLLAGCLTAAENAGLDPEDLEDIAGWTQGSQGVAQRLVDSSSGVQCAVGMRYQIETNAAFAFLTTFFESLLEETPGHVEAAVRAGRVKLARPEFPPSWSAPVIFRTRGSEPMFKFLADIPKNYEIERIDNRDQEVREALWTALSLDPNYEFAYKKLEETENRIRDEAAKKLLALLMPEMKRATPGETLEVAVNLTGTLRADSLTCKLSVRSDQGAARIEALRVTQSLKDSGFSLGDTSEAGDDEITFTITRAGGTLTLPEGPLLVAELTLGPVAPAKHIVRLDVIDAAPGVRVRPVDNVVLVPVT